MGGDEALYISDDLARSLIDEQFPHLARYELGRRYTLEDHLALRIGDGFGAIFPRVSGDDDCYSRVAGLIAPQATAWDFPASYPIATGRPAHGYPWHWVIVNWISASTAGFVPLHPGAVAPLGRALTAVHRTAPPGAPLNPRTGRGLDALREDFHAVLGHAEREGAPENRVLDADATRAQFEIGAAAAIDTPAAWTHGRLEPRAILSDRGMFAGILLWQYYGAGDIAADLGHIAAVISLDMRSEFLDAYGSISPETSARAVAYQVHAALTYIRLGDPFLLRMGWERLLELDLVTGG